MTKPQSFAASETAEQSGRFDWDALVPQVVHPVKVSIVEALLRVDEPMSASGLAKLLSSPPDHYLTMVSYHLRTLEETGLVAVIERRQGGGNTEETTYRLTSSFSWAELVRGLLHPTKVAIIEAIGGHGPSSAKQLSNMLDEKLQNTAYHVRELAVLGAITEVSSRQVRGARERFFALGRLPQK